MDDKKKKEGGYQPFADPDGPGAAAVEEENERLERDRILDEYLRQNYEREDRLAVVTIERLEGGRTGQVKQYLATAEEIASPEFQSRLRGANAHNRDIFISPNTIKPEATGRTKNDVDQIRHLYLDVDVGGREAVDKILAAEGMPKPHHIIETSPGKHQLTWQVEGFDKLDAEKTLRNLAAAHGADPAVTDSSRVLRPPGFRNCKYADPHWVRDVADGKAPDRVYGPGDFPKYPEAERPSPAPGQARQRFSGNGSVSQSERDWAYAMRQLEKGVSPDVIRGDIERFRAGEKPDPRYYADRTVSRAQAKFVARSTPSESGPAARDGIER